MVSVWCNFNSSCAILNCSFQDLGAVQIQATCQLFKQWNHNNWALTGSSDPCKNLPDNSWEATNWFLNNFCFKNMRSKWRNQFKIWEIITFSSLNLLLLSMIWAILYHLHWLKQILTHKPSKTHAPEVLVFLYFVLKGLWNLL